MGPGWACGIYLFRVCGNVGVAKELLRSPLWVMDLIVLQESRIKIEMSFKITFGCKTGFEYNFMQRLIPMFWVTDI